MSSIRHTAFALALAATSVTAVQAQTLLLADSYRAPGTAEFTLLPGSSAVEGQPFVAELRGPANGFAIVAISGEETGVALGRNDAAYTEKVRVALDADGRGELRLFSWRAGSQLVLRAFVASPGGRLSQVTQSLSVRPVPSPTSGPQPFLMHADDYRAPASAPIDDTPKFPPPPPGPPVVSPAVGTVGGQVVISGTALSALNGYAAKDVRVISPAISGCVGKVDAISSSSVTATITAAGPYPAPASLLLQGGSGTFTNVPQFAGMSYTQAVWGWKAVSGSPTMSSGTQFQTAPQTVFEPCGDPDMFVDLRYRLEGGIVKVKLPGTKACKGDKFQFEIGFVLSDGTAVAVSTSTTTGLPPTSSWASDILFPLWPLTFAYLGSGCTPSYNAGTNELWINPPSGKSITSLDPVSFMEIQFDPTQHTILTETHGVDDNYLNGNGGELTTPSAAYETWALGYYPWKREYDMNGCDLFLRDTFSGYGPGSFGKVCSSNLQVHMAGFGCQTDTDGIWFGWHPGFSVDWSIALPRLRALNYAWNPGDDATLCFDLSQLPIVDTANKVVDTRNILETVNQNALHVAIHDDTTVDYVTVKVLRCITP